MRNRTYGGVRGRKTKVGRKLLRFPPTRLSFDDNRLLMLVSEQVVDCLHRVEGAKRYFHEDG